MSPSASIIRDWVCRLNAERVVIAGGRSMITQPTKYSANQTA